MSVEHADIPAVVIVGRPNVGKSLLFNRLIKRRQALVHHKPGMTLDFLRERLTLTNGREVWLSDTGGVSGESDEWTDIVEQQMLHVSASADLFLLVVDYQIGLHRGDIELVQQLRKRQVPWLLVVNKAENTEQAMAVADFYSLTSEHVIAVSAKHGSDLDLLRARLQEFFPLTEASKTEAEATTETASDGADEKHIRMTPEQEVSVAIVGRPNVGKSTFINRLLGDNRLAVSERPGTTRDAVSCYFNHEGAGDFVLIDTAGMSRRRMTLERDKLSVAATRRALEHADCAILMIDLSEGVTYQDKRIMALIEEAGCAITVIANKADLVPAGEREKSLKQVMDLLPQMLSPPSFMLSATAKRQLPVTKLLAAVRRVAQAAYTHMPTATLNNALSDILIARSPRQHGKTRPKLRYAHQGGSRPPCIVIHGNAINRIDDSYVRYLSSAFGRYFKIVGNRVKVVFRGDENPYLPKRSGN
ncbi:MAG: ribosome biogenesis GTPase Der [Proteobacteria bacterium]|nr:ribosome biogenesis GTPase Der [Pseudomonadota bacterium]